MTGVQFPAGFFSSQLYPYQIWTHPWVIVIVEKGRNCLSGTAAARRPIVKSPDNT
jgi:hypothetical protein